MRKFLSLWSALAVLLGSLGTAQAGSSWPFSIEPSPFGGFYRRQWAPELPICLTDYQIRRAIAREGFTDIFLNIPHDDYVQVRARRGNWLYLLRFNYCTGRIEEVRRYRPA